MDKNFIKVSALPCNEKGVSLTYIPYRFEFELSSDLVNAIDGNEVILKAGKTIKLNGICYTDLKLVVN